MLAMKILILSDSHGDTAALRQAILRENPDRVFHLGDMYRDAQRMAAAFSNLPLDAVLGNCDAYSGAEGPEELLTTAGDVKFFLTHGHRYHVKMGTALLLREGQSAGADVICFGHTHRAVCRKHNGVWLVNPGTAGGVGAPATCAVAEVEDGEVSVEIKSL